MAEARPRSPAQNLVTEGLTSAFRLLRWGGLLAVLVVFGSGITIVKQDEVALRLRFGRLTGETAADQVHGPGLLVSFPYLIDEVVRVPVKRVREMTIDALRSRNALAFKRVDITRDGYALTGDHNLMQPAVLLKYQISDPVAWALKIQEPETHVLDAVVAALTRTLAEMQVDAVLVEGKRYLATAARQRAQAALDRGGHFVTLVALEFTSLQPPVQVAQYFNDVQKAIVEKKTLEEKARGYEEQEIPMAEAERDNLVNEAEAYRADQMADAEGEAEAFLNLLAEYRKNPDVVWRRIYLEAMEELISRLGSKNLLPPGLKAYHIFLPGQVVRPVSDGE